MTFQRDWALLFLTLLKLICMFAEEVLVGSVVQLTVMRVRKACFRKAIKGQQRCPQTITLDGHAASHRAVRELTFQSIASPATCRARRPPCASR